MKYIKLSLSRIAGYIFQNKLIFVLFFIGSMLSSFVFIYFYGNEMSSKRITAENGLEFRSFEVWFDSDIKITDQDLELLDAYQTEAVTVSSTIQIPEEYEHLIMEDTRVYLAAEISKLTNMSDMFEELDQNTDVVMLPKIFGENIDEFMINDVPLRVVGRTDNRVVCFVPMATFQRLFAADTIYYTLENQLTQAELREAEEILENSFPNAQNIITPDTHKTYAAQRDVSALVRIAGLYILAVISFLFLYKYLFDQTNYENIIYNVVGSTKSVVLKIMLIEIVLLTSVSTGFAAVIHALFYEPFFSRINKSALYIPYHFLDYFLVMIFTVSLSLISTLPFVINYRRKSLRDLSGQYRI